MKRTFIAGIAALSLALTSVPAQAQQTGQGFEHEDLATAFFALLALGVIGKSLSNHDNNDGYVDTAPRHEPRRISPDWREPRRIGPDHGGLRNNRGSAWWDEPSNRPNRGNVVTTRNHDLPASCLRDVRSVRGTHRMFGRGCLRNNYAYVNRLPARCEIQVTSNRRIRHGYSPQCLAEFGYGVNRRH